jgi:hypothetical protein
MKCLLNKTVKTYLLSLLLASVALLFVHLELEILNLDMGNHDAGHYFIVKMKADSRIRNIKDILPNHGISKTLCQNSALEVETPVSHIRSNKSKMYLETRQSTKFHLFNMYFLI